MTSTGRWPVILEVDFRTTAARIIAPPRINNPKASLYNPAVQALRTRIEAIRTRFGDDSAPELRRAMGNLRSAIQIRLSKGELSKESLSSITAALDRAANEIERS